MSHFFRSYFGAKINVCSSFFNFNFLINEGANQILCKQLKMIPLLFKSFCHLAQISSFNSTSTLNTFVKRKKGKESTDQSYSLITRCLKITEKVSFNIASEASYVYIFSRQKLIKNAKNGPFWRVFENLKHAVKQCYQTGQF